MGCDGLENDGAGVEIVDGGGGVYIAEPEGEVGVCGRGRAEGEVGAVITGLVDDRLRVEGGYFSMFDQLD